MFHEFFSAQQGNCLAISMTASDDSVVLSEEGTENRAILYSDTEGQEHCWHEMQMGRIKELGEVEVEYHIQKNNVR